MFAKKKPLLLLIYNTWKNSSTIVQYAQHDVSRNVSIFYINIIKTN